MPVTGECRNIQSDPIQSDQRRHVQRLLVLIAPSHVVRVLGSRDYAQMLSSGEMTQTGRPIKVMQP